MSLRLAVTLLTACLGGQRLESESLSCLCCLSMWIKALLVTMRFLETQIGSCRIWSDWKCSGLLPLVLLALSGPEEALWWFLSQLRHFFLWNLWKSTGRISPSSLRTKITLSSLADTFTITYTDMAMSQHFYCGQDCTQECAWPCIRWMLPLAVLAWETFGASCSAPPQVASEEKGKSDKCLGGRELKINLGCHQVYPWCISTPPPWW